MKISLSAIIVAHFNSLRDYRTGKVSYSDLFVFFLCPAIIAGLGFIFELKVSNESFDVLISAFSIFSALLFSAQVAIYGIFRADRRRLQDPVMQAIDHERFNEVRKLLKEINANISYLIMLAFGAVSIFLLFFILCLSEDLEATISTFIFFHFLLTAGMVLKRAHEIFDNEYSDR